jgi:glycine C-acetyltransferase
MSPVNAAIVLKAFEIIDSPEGKVLRNELMTNVLELRRQLTEAGLEYYGDPSAIVAVKMGTEGLARLVSRRLPELGLLCNLVEYPAVGKGAARFRMQVMAKHSAQNVTDAVARIKAARLEAEIELATMGEQAPRMRAVA